MKNFFKRFGVVFLAVMFLFCSLTVSVFAEEAPPDQTDQTETTAVESSAAEGSAIQVVTEDFNIAGNYFYFEEGWSCEAGAFNSENYDFSGLLPYPAFIFCSGDGFFLYVVHFYIGYSYSESELVETADSIVFIGYFFDVESSESEVRAYTLTPEDSFSFGFSPDQDFGDPALVSFVEDYGELLCNMATKEFSPLVTETYVIPSGWTVSSACYISSESFDFKLNGKIYRDYNILIGYTLGEEDLVPAENTILFFSDSGDGFMLTSEDSFTLELLEFDPGVYYFARNNGTIAPPTLMESILDIFLSVGEWISGAVSALIPLFWDSSAGALTFVGVLSVSGLAFSVSMLLISLISKFLRFGG